jgi:hypothetical protein
MQVVVENGIKLTVVDLEEFENDLELRRAMQHFSKYKTPYVEAVLDERENYGSVTITVPEEWEEKCIFLFEELYEKLSEKGIELARYASPSYIATGYSVREVTFFLPSLSEGLKVAKEIARIAYECIERATPDIAGEVKVIDGIQYVVVRSSHEFWCNDYKNGDKIVRYCLRYRVPYIQLALKIPYLQAERARIDVYLLKEWVDANTPLPENIKRRLIEFVEKEPPETDIIAHTPPRWFKHHYGYRSEWWGIITPEFVVIPAVYVPITRAFKVAEEVAKVVYGCIADANKID